MLRHGRESPIDIRLVDVVRAEGMTTGAAYQIWPSQDAFRRDVAVHVASAFDWAGPELIASKVSELVASGASREERLRTIGRLYFENFCANEEYFTVLQLYAVRNASPELAEALQRGYDVVHDGFVQLFEFLLVSSGLQMRAPYIIDDLAVVVTALTEGLAMRTRVQPERVRTSIPADDGGEDWHIYSAALLSAASFFTEELPDSVDDA